MRETEARIEGDMDPSSPPPARHRRDRRARRAARYLAALIEMALPGHRLSPGQEPADLVAARPARLDRRSRRGTMRRPGRPHIHEVEVLVAWPPGAPIELRAPGPGSFVPAIAPGDLVAAGAAIGELVVLGRSSTLIVPRTRRRLPRPPGSRLRLPRPCTRSATRRARRARSVASRGASPASPAAATAATTAASCSAPHQRPVLQPPRRRTSRRSSPRQPAHAGTTISCSRS